MTTFTRRSASRLVVMLVVLGVFTACGDDAGTTTTPASETTTTAADVTTTTAATPVPGDATTWCAAVIDFDEFAAELPDATTTEEFDELVADILPRLRVLASGAPDAIRMDLSLIVESLEQYLDGDDTAIVGDDYFDAFDRFEEFVLDVCDYELVG
jgi:ABC-type glycerol-3-phosphate transport system substrate-binding protein